MAQAINMRRPLIPVGRHGGSRGTVARVWSNFVKTDSCDAIRNLGKVVLREERHRAQETQRGERGPELRAWKKRMPKGTARKPTMRSLAAKLRKSIRDELMGR